MIVDIRNGLTIADVLPIVVSSWKPLFDLFLKELYAFANDFVHNNNAMFLINFDEGQN